MQLLLPKYSAATSFATDFTNFQYVRRASALARGLADGYDQIDTPLVMRCAMNGVRMNEAVVVIDSKRSSGNCVVMVPKQFPLYVCRMQNIAARK